MNLRLTQWMQWGGGVAMLSFSWLNHAGVLLTDVVGTVKIEGRNGTVSLLTDVTDGQTLQLETGAKVVAVDLKTGSEYVLQQKGRYLVKATGLEDGSGRKLASNALPVQNLPNVRVVAGKFQQAALVMRSTPIEGTIPIPRQRVTQIQPYLAWSHVEGAQGYRLQVRSISSNDVTDTSDTQVQAQTPKLWIDKIVPQAGYQIREKAEALTAGNIYECVAIAQTGNTPAATVARFEIQVMPPDVVARFDTLRSLAPKAWHHRVLLAAQLRQVGALQEAKLQWLELMKERPNHPDLPTLAELN